MKKILISILVIIMSFAMISCTETETGDGDIVKYENNIYRLIDFSGDIFVYGYYTNEYIEEDCIYKINHALVYQNGDIYCIEDEHETYQKQYRDVSSYDWFISIDEEKDIPLELTEEEIAFFDTVEEGERNVSIFVDEIEHFASIGKMSKDGIVRSTTELAFYEGNWYWRSEIINEDREMDGTWPEYVHQLPQSLNDKIKSVM